MPRARRSAIIPQPLTRRPEHPPLATLLSPEELTKIGQRLYGRRAWTARMAEALGVADSTVWRWAHGRRRIEPLADAAIRGLLDKHKLRKLAA